MTTTTTITADQLTDLAWEANGEAYFRYSGRSMYGKECVGITLSNITDLLNIGAALYAFLGDGHLTDEVYSRFMRGASTDNMGRGMIVYWPNITCIDAPADADNDEEA